jgi:integrase
VPLTEIECRTAKPKTKPYKLTDANGLQLWVHTSGSRTWRLAYRFAGKQRSITFGQYPTITLGEARRKRDDVRRLLWEGRDPEAVVTTTTASVDRTFKAVATTWFELRKDGWVEDHAKRVWSRLVNDVFPEIGTMEVQDIKVRHILTVIRKVEDRGALDVSRRIRQTIGKIFQFAIVEELCEVNPATEDLNVALKPKPKVKHFASLKEAELPEFFERFATYNGDAITRYALQFTIQTLVRTSETRFAAWCEFEDLDGGAPLWRIPPERMKMGREHLVPLSRQTVALLRDLRSITGKYDLLFPASTKKGVISQNTMIFAMYRMGYHSRATVHGFRGTASTILNENGFNEDWIERQLAHDEDDEIRAAYNSAEYLPGRRQMVQWWCDRLDLLANRDKVIPMRVA